MTITWLSQGYKLKDAYIATQGPLANTSHDFWRLVWEQESSCIIMLTNLVEKSRVRGVAKYDVILVQLTFTSLVEIDIQWNMYKHNNSRDE